jgi:hypothetical protein
VKLNRWFVIGGFSIEEFEQKLIVSVEFNSRKPNITD